MTSSALPTPAAPKRRRSLETRRSVILVDKTADWVIRIGGIGVIVAVFGIMAYLTEVVLPLFSGASMSAERQVATPAVDGRILMTRVDEYKTLSIAVTDTGAINVFHLGSGKPIAAGKLDLGGRSVTGFARTLSGDDIVFGFADGTVSFGKLTIAVQILPADAMPAGARPIEGSGDRSDGKAIYSQIPGNQIRRLAVEASVEPAVAVAEPAAPIVAIDYRLGGTVERPTKTFVTADATGAVRLSLAETKVNLMTGQARTTVDSSVLPALPRDFKVVELLVTDKADQVYVADRNGTIVRYDTRDFAKPVIAETIDLLPGDVRLTAVAFLIGEQSLVVGSSDGAVDVYFKLQRQGSRSVDGFTLIRAHRLEPHTKPVLKIRASQRSKLFITADEAGDIMLRHTTSEQTVLRMKPRAGEVRYATLDLAPRENGVVAVADGRASVWDIDAPHPETTFASIFGKVWYEGYDGPSYTWQSSSGTDSFEPKLSLVPLIFGTIKAAFYSLLFAVPLAIAAAIYTSEFVHPTVRGVVKPTMELMASLPSVVLGFIAALILAPIVETWIAAVLMAFVGIPMGLFLGAYLWQMLPTPVALRHGNIPKFALMFVAIGLAMAACYAGGGLFERLLFQGDFRTWLNGTTGSGTPFLFLMLWPLSFFAALHLFDRYIDPQHAARIREMPRTRGGAFDMMRWLGIVVLSGAIAYGLGAILNGIGADPRGTLVDTYVQRNTLVVGFAMAFAVIPLIYTIAEDALNAVPEHLRGASLACGATPWQTAIRVILPTAASGVFAAVMVGMGRAVGETMIVVMAAGNTPILEWNIFNGLRALSANIAVELPEAVKDSTLFRMLFLAALVLFAMTFIINTAAELVRQRFRKRSAQL